MIPSRLSSSLMNSSGALVNACRILFIWMSSSSERSLHSRSLAASASLARLFKNGIQHLLPLRSWQRKYPVDLPDGLLVFLLVHSSGFLYLLKMFLRYLRADKPTPVVVPSGPRRGGSFDCTEHHESPAPRSFCGIPPDRRLICRLTLNLDFIREQRNHRLGTVIVQIGER